MNLKYIYTDKLTEDEKSIRTDVFINEQGFKEEFDSIDNCSSHIIIYDGNTPIACCRYFSSETDGEYYIGRIAVVKKYRGRQLGEKLVAAAENKIRSSGGKIILLSAQTRVRGFYEKLGFSITGEPYFEEYCEHIRMEKQL